jgi:hypothetical protein
LGRHFTDEEKKDKWVRIVAPVGAEGISLTREGTGPTPVQSPLTLYSTLLSPSTALSHRIAPGNSKAYVHVVQTSGYNVGEATGATVRVTSGEDTEGGVVLKEGDGLYVHVEKGKEAEIKVSNEGGTVAEVLLFDVE